MKKSMRALLLSLLLPGETFKYFYLLFAPPQTLDPGKVVLSTEAHPIRPTWAVR